MKFRWLQFFCNGLIQCVLTEQKPKGLGNFKATKIGIYTALDESPFGFDAFAYFCQKRMMRIVQILLIVLVLFASCKNDQQALLEAQKRESERVDVLVAQLQSQWRFSLPEYTPEQQAFFQDWGQWFVLLTELQQAPKGSLKAFQDKASTLSLKVKDVTVSIPQPLQKPELISRFTVLRTKINALDLFIHLDQIPMDKVNICIVEINEQLRAIQAQVQEYILRTSIPVEEGEREMIEKMRDTTRLLRNSPTVLDID